VTLSRDTVELWTGRVGYEKENVKIIFCLMINFSKTLQPAETLPLMLIGIK
jgi:hypothetical protein